MAEAQLFCLLKSILPDVEEIFLVQPWVWNKFYLIQSTWTTKASSYTTVLSLWFLYTTFTQFTLHYNIGFRIYAKIFMGRKNSLRFTPPFKNYLKDIVEQLI